MALSDPVEVMGHPYIPPDRPESRDDLVNLYGPFVGHWAKYYHSKAPNGHRTLEDMAQDGWLGVLEAWDDYDPSKGMIFRAYVTYRIKWAIMNGARRADRNLGRLYVQESKGRARPEDYHLMMAESLDDPDNLKAPNAVAVTNHELEVKLSNESFLRLLSMVNKGRIRWVLDQRFRLDRDLVDIGRELKVSRERVRQIMVQGLEIIRKKLAREKE